ncbi:MAG TPA: SGNH/GDSL hydrolase family protein [Thermoanaerobaculia bacterium]|nr:SGNH/GDSL hydrolase family protein [Thermoanaerobaculia bacterium]
MAFLFPVAFSCTSGGGSASRRILALGDSYTIGEAVSAPERWPNQLAALLKKEGIEAADPEIIARTGWTTDELDRAIDAAAPAGPYDLVTLLIGVNNQYRGRPGDEYRREFGVLLQRAIGFAGGDASRVLVLSIPDWGVTPFAADRDRGKIGEEIDLFNRVNREEADRLGARYVDVTPVSRTAATDAALIASDGLHPSGAMYARWAELSLPAARAALLRR